MYAQAYFDSALKPRFLTLSSSMEMETGWGNHWDNWRKSFHWWFGILVQKRPFSGVPNGFEKKILFKTAGNPFKFLLTWWWHALYPKCFFQLETKNEF